MRPSVFAFIVVLMVGLALPAHAARFTGEYLLQVCASDKNGKEIVPGGHIACQAYIAGVMDYHNLIKSMGTAPGIDFCVPDQEGMYNVQRRVTSYVFRKRSEHAAFIASPGVALALYGAYPCKGKKKP
jgi:hypothetical protein